MQINGDKFLRNLEIEKERAALEKQKEELMFQRAQAHTKLDDRYNENEAQTNMNYQELDDIRIDKDSSNKQKYILLGFILVLLFLITLVTIKLISEPQKENNFSQNDIVDEKKAEAVAQNPDNNASTDANGNKSLDIDKIIQSEDNAKVKVDEKAVQVQPAKPAEGDIFGIEKKDTTVKVAKTIEPSNTPKTQPAPTKVQASPVVTTPTPAVVQQPVQAVAKPVTKEAAIIKEAPIKPKPKKEEVKKEEPKKEEVKKEVKKIEAPKQDLWKQTPKVEEPAQATSSNVIYIQGGAFTAVPDPKLIETLKKNNFKYTFKTVEVDGKSFSKLFIGGYPSHEKALEDLAKVRSEINPKAFIPKGQ